MHLARSYALLAILTLAAGYTDAVSFFGLGVFTANMTGNTVLLAGALAQRFVPHVPGSFSVALTALSLSAFVLGAALAAFVLRGETGRPPVRTIGVVAAVAMLMALAAYLFQGRVAGYVADCVALLSVVAGVQSAVAARAGVPGITTIVVTGTMVTALIGFFGSAPGNDRRSGAGPYAADWALYLVGAAAGTVGLGLLAGHALWPPVVVVALLLPVL